uniref:Uncharacterized protein n=1 Tax=Spironucleus salmonicida TaxID=348837 RepID=V6LNT0_9EUKA|eukprot:EST45898.1 Hypothetical protein SS50377_14143 [Spironucleus salmonicida]
MTVYNFQEAGTTNSCPCFGFITTIQLHETCPRALHLVVEDNAKVKQGGESYVLQNFSAQKDVGLLKMLVAVKGNHWVCGICLVFHEQPACQPERFVECGQLGVHALIQYGIVQGGSICEQRIRIVAACSFGADNERLAQYLARGSGQAVVAVEAQHRKIGKGLFDFGVHVQYLDQKVRLPRESACRLLFHRIEFYLDPNISQVLKIVIQRTGRLRIGKLHLGSGQSAGKLLAQLESPGVVWRQVRRYESAFMWDGTVGESSI